MRELKTLILGMTILSGMYSGAVAAEKNLFGTLHGHSNWSIDAFGIGNTSLGPEKAYEFARGEQVTHLNGAEVQLSHRRSRHVGRRWACGSLCQLFDYPA